MTIRAKCRTANCETMVTRIIDSDPRYCMECRRTWHAYLGPHQRERQTVGKGYRPPGYDRLASRLQDGFTAFRDDEKDNGD